MHELQNGAAQRNQMRYGARAACVTEQLQPSGTRCAYSARAACMPSTQTTYETCRHGRSDLCAGRGGHAERRPLVLPSHSGNLVTPEPELQNTALLP